MTNEKDRTESQPAPMSENEAETVVGGDESGNVSQYPCVVPNCSCVYLPPNCSCQGHTHVN